MIEQSDFQQYLTPTYFIDSDHPDIKNYGNSVIKNCSSEKEKAVKLYFAVRDDIYYDPYSIELTPESMKASTTLSKKSGYCVAKAVVLAAVARATGIPAKLGFADVKNHLSSERLKSLMQTDIFVYHGYNELYIDGKWIKVTPTFNLSLCDKFGVAPLDFDGENDALFHEFDTKGQKHMEYIKYHGTFADLPVDDIYKASRKAYPEAFKMWEKASAEGNFENED